MVDCSCSHVPIFNETSQGCQQDNMSQGQNVIYDIMSLRPFRSPALAFSFLHFSLAVARDDIVLRCDGAGARAPAASEVDASQEANAAPVGLIEAQSDLPTEANPLVNTLW